MNRNWIGRCALVAAIVLTALGPAPASADAPAPFRDPTAWACGSMIHSDAVAVVTGLSVGPMRSGAPPPSDRQASMGSSGNPRVLSRGGAADAVRDELRLTLGAPRGMNR